MRVEPGGYFSWKIAAQLWGRRFELVDLQSVWLPKTLHRFLFRMSPFWDCPVSVPSYLDTGYHLSSRPGPHLEVDRGISCPHLCSRSRSLLLSSDCASCRAPDGLYRNRELYQLRRRSEERIGRCMRRDGRLGAEGDEPYPAREQYSRESQALLLTLTSSEGGSLVCSRES